jgi:methionine-rich copper-binding protein CopC
VKRLLTLIALGALATTTPAWSHATLTRIDTHGSDTAATLTLTFDGGIEVRFSQFALLPLTLSAEAEAALADHDPTRANAIAAKEAASFRRGAATPLPDCHAAAGAHRHHVTITCRDGLPPGAYVLVVDVLALDGHLTRDHRLLLIPPPDGVQPGAAEG